MVDIEGAILYVNTNEIVADITQMLLIVRFEGDRLYCLSLLSLMAINVIYLKM